MEKAGGNINIDCLISTLKASIYILFKAGSSPKGKNLLIREQILSFRS